MSFISGWVSQAGEAEARAVVTGMATAMRVNERQEIATWSIPGIAIGLTDLPVGRDALHRSSDPATSGDGRYRLWLAGEVLDGGPWIAVANPDDTRGLAFRRRLLELLVEHDVDVVRALDGEYVIALWDARDKRLTIYTDRFAGLPVYWAASKQGVAFAGGVRGVLMAPGIESEPDVEAIREAVTFGGYRLGDRTNIRSVKMLPGAANARIEDGVLTALRYWNWRDVRPIETASAPELIDELQTRWTLAIRRRVAGQARFGQTLSGGLDSRAILAEGVRHTTSWSALTYGAARCDDARYAEQAARAADAQWVFFELFEGDWLTRRSDFIQHTDGLIDLVDLMHLESATLQPKLFDVHMSGYIGDVVIGPTFNGVASIQDVMSYLPRYETPIGLPPEVALERVSEATAQLDGAPMRCGVFECKLAQSTNRWSTAFRSWVRVRRPFIDYQFFDFAQGLATEVRGRDAVYERWLWSRYPEFFRSIPNQKTGLPVMTPRWRINIDRAQRLAWRKVQPGLARAGLRARARVRYFHPDNEQFGAPEARSRIEASVLHADSISAEVFGRDQLRRFLNEYFERGNAPVQVPAALYVYETYHRGLAAFLKSARASAANTLTLGA